MTRKLIKTSTNLKLYANNENEQNIDQDEPDKGLLSPQKFIVTDKKESEIGTFTLAPMPGCCGLVVSTALFLIQEYRSTPIGKEFMELKEWTPEYLGYSAVIATVQLENMAELKSSAKRQYKIIANWRNDRTGNELGIIFKKTNL